jgi:hypothetical protein
MAASDIFKKAQAKQSPIGRNLVTLFGGSLSIMYIGMDI